MSKLKKASNKKLILVLPIILVVSFVVLLTYSFATFKSIKLFDAVGGFFLGNEYTLSYDVANCTSKTIKNGKTFGELCVPATPDGYEFEGWYYNGDLIESTSSVRTNQNIELLAHFTQVISCNVGTTYEYEYDPDNDGEGQAQTFTAHCPGKYKVELWGASGKQFQANRTTFALGGYTSGMIDLNENDVLYVYIGEHGNNLKEASYNGGGTGGYGGNGWYGSSGGGATDVRTVSGNWDDFSSLKSRIMVAAGGGGDGDYSYSGQNSSAGGLTGYKGNYYQGHGDLYAYGYGGTQIAAGANGNNVYDGTGTASAGGFGYGASSSSQSDRCGAGGGGGGYFGGGAGGATAKGGAGHGGGGGSSYISGHAGCLAINGSSTSDNITLKDGCTSSSTSIDCSKHYSGKYFKNTIMIDGQGYNWTTTKGTLVNQTQPDGTSAVGHNGDGYARITYLGNNSSDQVVNYRMLYDGTLGSGSESQMTDLTGGWVTNSGIRFGGCGGDAYNFSYRYNDNNIYYNVSKNSYFNHGGALYTVNQIDLTDYNGLYGYVKWSKVNNGAYSLCYNTGGGRFCTNGGYCNNAFGNPKSGYDVLACSNLSSVTGQYTIGIGGGTCGDNVASVTVNVYGIWFTYADNWQELNTILNTSETSIVDLLNNHSTDLLANQEAVTYMLKNCTGDFLTAAIFNSTFMTALDTSPYKDAVYANDHWSKFLTIASN